MKSDHSTPENVVNIDTAAAIIAAGIIRMKRRVNMNSNKTLDVKDTPQKT
jgi:hypothetical protein